MQDSLVELETKLLDKTWKLTHQRYQVSNFKCQTHISSTNLNYLTTDFVSFCSKQANLQKMICFE